MSSETLNPFPLNIAQKQDSWDKAQILQFIDPTLKLPAAEINKIVKALEFLYTNSATGSYTGNVPLNLILVGVDFNAPGSTLSKVVNAINALPTFALENGVTQWFYTNRIVLSNGPGISIDPNGTTYAVITEFFYLKKRLPFLNGVSSLGVGGYQLTTSDLLVLPSRDTRSFAPTTFDLGDIGNSSIWNAVNSGPGRSTPNTATIIFKAKQQGTVKLWLYIGVEENVGTGFPALTSSDFRLFPEDGSATDPAPPPPMQIFENYDDIADMITRQVEQTGNEIIRVTDASADPNIIFATEETRRWALYTYLQTNNDNLSDYRLESVPFGKMTSPPKQKIKTGNYTLTPDDNDATISMNGGVCTINPNTQTYPDAYVIAQKNITDATDGSIVCTAKSGWMYKVNDAAEMTDGTLSFPAGATCTIVKFEGTNKIYIDGWVE